MVAPVFFSNFIDAQALSDRNVALAVAKRAEIEKEVGSLKAFRASLKIDPLVSDTQYKTLAQMWDSVGEDKFEETNLRKALLQSLPGFDAKGLPISDVFKRHATEMTGGPGAVLIDFERKLKEYHGLAKSLFPIPGEIDPISVWREIPTKGNFDKEQKRDLGEFRDHSLLLRLPPDKDGKPGKLIGGIDFVVFAHKDGGPATVETNFIFLRPEFRDMGVSKVLEDARDNAAVKFLQKTAPDALRRHGGFYDMTVQNHPQKLDGESYTRDLGYSTPPVKRLRVFGKKNYAPIKFGYIEPMLEAGVPPSKAYQRYASFRKVVETAPGKFRPNGSERPKSILARTFYNHLNAFCEQSIDKIDGDNTAAEQLALLKPMVARGLSIGTVDPEQQRKFLDTYDRRERVVAKHFGATDLDDEKTMDELWIIANENAKAARARPTIRATSNDAPVDRRTPITVVPPILNSAQEARLAQELAKHARQIRRRKHHFTADVFQKIAAHWVATPGFAKMEHDKDGTTIHFDDKGSIHTSYKRIEFKDEKAAKDLDVLRASMQHAKETIGLTIGIYNGTKEFQGRSLLIAREAGMTVENETADMRKLAKIEARKILAEGGIPPGKAAAPPAPPPVASAAPPRARQRGLG